MRTRLESCVRAAEVPDRGHCMKTMRGKPGISVTESPRSNLVLESSPCVCELMKARCT